MDDGVERALRRAFPDREVSAASPVPRSDRPGNGTVRADFADGAVAYLKVAVDGGERARERLRRAAAATRYARWHADVRVPEVLAAEPDGDRPTAIDDGAATEPDPCRGYVATAALSGTAIATDWPAESTVARATVLRAVGRALAGVHAADEFSGHARIRDGDADGLELDRGSWSRTLSTTLSARADALFADRFRDCYERVMDVLAANRTRLDAAPAALVHDDPRPANCLVDSDGPGLVDWETAMVGDPALDVARAEAQYVERADVDDADRDRLRRALRAGYRDRAGRLPVGFGDRYPLYRAVTFLDTARTFEHWAPDAPEPVDELATWVRETLRSRLDDAVE
jgi:aminoglycoside phosphotransferase (APT) family kinase protein